MPWYDRPDERLPSDEPKDDPRKWYRTQKEHWLGWLAEYNGPGAYGRETGKARDAKFSYNHIVCPEMLLYLIKAASARPDLADAIEEAYRSGSTLSAKAGGIRKLVPWGEIRRAIWGEDEARRLASKRANVASQVF